MKSIEEFKDLVYDKRDLLVKQRKKRRQTVTAISLPLAFCAAALCFYPGIKSAFPVDEGVAASYYTTAALATYSLLEEEEAAGDDAAESAKGADKSMNETAYYTDGGVAVEETIISTTGMYYDEGTYGSNSSVLAIEFAYKIDGNSSVKTSLPSNTSRNLAAILERKRAMAAMPEDIAVFDGILTIFYNSSKSEAFEIYDMKYLKSLSGGECYVLDAVSSSELRALLK